MRLVLPGGEDWACGKTGEGNGAFANASVVMAVVGCPDKLALETKLRWQISLQIGDAVSYESALLAGPVLQPGQLSISAIGDEISVSGALQPANTTLT